jgi:alanyl-tRNA synthetase
MTLNEIRTAFLSFFAKKDHKILPSSHLVPHNDPSLLFTNSGMVQFKNYFLGLEESPYKRVTTSQKCVRAGGKHNDLEMVGYTARHHTFFEMLGNFSFGDYFKEEAISFAWEFLTKELKIDKNRLYITVYHTDEEAIKLWQKIAAITSDRLIKIDTNDNFWSMGPTGPCGPCSEIFYDHGDKYQGGLPGSDEEGDRFVEIWNLVFMQKEQLESGLLIDLPKKSIDTGIGLERLTAVMQGVNDNFSIDLFKKLIELSQDLSKINNLTSHKVIADHLRTISFLIAEGVLPSNEGRGYLLRRIMRRALRYARNLGHKNPFLHLLVPNLVDIMGGAYPELVKAEKLIQSVLYQEEDKFGATLDKGLLLLEEEVQKLPQGGKFPGLLAFKLYDTYGFPLDLTKDILRSKNLILQEEAFDQAMADQKKRARDSWKGSGDKANEKFWFELSDKIGPTEFLGYSHQIGIGKVLALVKNQKEINEVQAGEEILIFLNQTTFYGESGGQVGDTGHLEVKGKKVAEVLDTKIYPGKIFAHQVKILEKITLGEEITTIIDSKKRNNIKANHSATHLLHKVLRDKLGNHVTQKGSLVNEEKLRFDFSHNQALTANEIRFIEEEVNKKIRDNEEVSTKLMSKEEALQKGAMALFGEKYSEEVRVVTISDSLELCGGTHATRTGDIGLFKIVSEGAVASGVRRIEAVTGELALQYLFNKLDLLEASKRLFKSSDQDLLDKIEKIQKENKNLLKHLEEYQIKDLIKGLIRQEGFLLGESDLDPNLIRKALQSHQGEETIFILSGQTLLIKSPQEAKKFAEILIKELGAKGGGKDEIVQLSLPKKLFLKEILLKVRIK